jgi:hypothetical protein
VLDFVVSVPPKLRGPSVPQTTNIPSKIENLLIEV